MSVVEESLNQIKTMRENLKKFRKGKGWSIEELSQISRIDAEILRLMEDDKDFAIEYLFTLCDMYGVKIHEIFLPIEK